MENQERIELRSEKVRNIIGEVPPVLVRSGIGIVFGLILLLLIAIYLIPYPETLRVEVTVTSVSDHIVEAYADALVPFAYVNQVRKGMEVHVDMEGYAEKDYGFVKGTITEVSRQPITYSSKNYIIVKLLLHDKYYTELCTNMKGTASIMLSDKTIWEHLFR